MTTEKMTKKQIEESIYDFLSYKEASSELSESTQTEYQSRLIFFAKTYNDKLDLKSNLKRRLSSATTYSTFCRFRRTFMEWLEWAGFAIDLSDCEFTPKYITSFNVLEEKIKSAYDNKVELVNNSSEKTGSFFTLARLFAYLLWIGVPQKYVNEMKRTDYDPSSRIIKIDDMKIDLNDIYYQSYGCSDIVHNELMKNISSFSCVYDNQFMEYYDASKGITFGQKILNFSDEHIMRTSRGHTDTTIKHVRNAVSKCFFSTPIIYKSGLFGRMKIWSDVNEKKITVGNIEKILKELQCVLTSYNHIVVEYNDYLELL